MTDPESKQAMIEPADSYERLAQRLMIDRERYRSSSSARRGDGFVLSQCAPAFSDTTGHIEGRTQ